MDISIDDFRSQILNGITINDDAAVKLAQENFYALLDENPCLTLQLLIENSNSNDPSNSASITLLGTAALYISDKLVKIGDEQFHQDFQSSLLTLLQNSSLTPYLLSNVSFIISRYSRIYSSNWPSLLENLLQIINDADQPSFSIDCLNYCISNNSIVCDDQGLEIISQLIQDIFDSIPDLNLQFLSTVRLVFSLYQCESIDEAFRSNLNLYSEKIISVNFENSDQAVHEKYMIELSNFADNNIEFFESTLENLVDLLGSKICSEENSDIIENSSILVLKDIFCNKKYVNIFQSKSIEVYDLLNKVISIKLTEAGIDPDEGINTLNESNTISIAKDTIKSIGCNYGGIDEISIHIISSFGDQQEEDNELFVSNFISFGSVIKEIIDFIDPVTFISFITSIYKVGFASENEDCRYRSVVSLKKVIKAIDLYPDDFQWESQEIFSLIFDTLGNETIPAIITALLLALKASLATFDDYHDSIEDIIQPLDQNFDSFTSKQQSIIISCYSCCCLICEDENDPFQELMHGIFNRILSVLGNGYQNSPDDFYFACLDAVLDFDKFVSSSDLFNEISPLMLEFIASFDSITAMIENLSYKQIDIVNQTLRNLISICPKDQILDFSGQILEPIFLLSLSDITPTKYLFQDYTKSELQMNNEVIRSNDESSWICYSKDLISIVSEALGTIYSILGKIPDMADHFMPQVIEIIEKWIGDCFSYTLVYKCAQILILLLKDPKMKEQDKESFIFNTFIKIISAFDLIGDVTSDKFEESSDETIELIQLFTKIFDFIGENFNSPNSMSIVIGEDESIPNPINLIFRLHSKWSELHQLGFSSSSEEDKKNDEFSNKCVKVETAIGSIFEPLFKYFSYNEVDEKISPLLDQYFPIDNTDAFFTPTFFYAYSSMAIYSSLCNDEQIMKIGSVFSDILVNGFDCFPSYVSANAAESIMKIANSGRVSPSFFLSLIEKVEEAIQIDKEKIDRYIIPHLLFLIENLEKGEINLEVEQSDKNALIDRLFDLLLNILPVSFLVVNDNTYRSAASFLSIVSMNHPSMNDPNNLAKICTLALVFIIVHKPSKKILKQLRLFIKSVFFSEQGQAVYDEIMNLPLSTTFGNDCVNYIDRMMESQDKE